MPGLATGMDPFQQNIRDEDDDAFDDGGEYDEINYKPRPQLPKPFICMRSLADLIRDLDNGLIDVDPEYQREVVWTADRMTGLINSLMENFYIPPIILNKKTITASANNPKGAVHVCVDGKQRLSSVRAFVKGMIPAHDHRGIKWWFSDAISRRKNILSEDSQRAFLGKEFVSFEFKDLSSEQEEDLFARVQMGVQLSAAEKMRASSGPWQELAKLFVEDFPIIYSLMKDRARAKDFQLTLSCFSQLVEVMHPSAPDGNPNMKMSAIVLPKLLSNKSALDDGLKSHLASIWNIFKDLIAQDEDTFTNADKYLRGVQTFAPMEMVAVTVLISMYSKTRNRFLLLGDIRAMREAIRENFTDIRMNSTVWKFIWNFVENLEAIRGAVDGSTIQCRVEQPSQPLGAVASVSVPLAGGKRKEAPTKAKQPSVLPPLPPAPQPFTVKKEETAHMPLMQPTEPTASRQPKRQRIESSQTHQPSSAFQQLNKVLAPTRSPERQIVPPNLQPQYPPMPTHAPPSTIAQGPPRARSPSAPQTQGDRRPGTITLGGESSSKHPVSPWVSPSQGWASMPPMPTGDSTLGSSDAPQNQYRARIPSVSPSTFVAQNSVKSPMHSPIATSSTCPPDNGPPERILLEPSSSLRAGLGPYSPSHTEQQWSGEVRTVTPPLPSNSRRSPVKRKPSQQSRKAPQQSTAAPYNGVIDLTGDSEQEREEPLSSFKAKAVPMREQHNAPNRLPSGATSQPPQKMQTVSRKSKHTPQNSASGIDMPHGFDRISTRMPAESLQNSVTLPGPWIGNNPYAKFRQGANSPSFPP